MQHTFRVVLNHPEGVLPNCESHQTKGKQEILVVALDPSMGILCQYQSAEKYLFMTNLMTLILWSCCN